MKHGVAVRRTMAGLLLVGAAGLTSVSSFTDHARVCEDVVPRIGTHALARSCRPLEPSDPPLIALAVAVALLLAPELAEVSVFGVGWKRRIEATETSQRELASQVQTLQQLQISSQHVNQTFIGMTSESMSDPELKVGANKARQRLEDLQAVLDAAMGISSATDDNETSEARELSGDDGADSTDPAGLAGTPEQEQK